MIHNTRAQAETGPLQKLMFSLLLISVVAVLSLSFVSDLGGEYDVTVNNDSSFTKLDQAQKTQNRTETIANTIGNIDNPLDFITAAITGSYNVLLLFTSDIPSDFSVVIDVVQDTLGLPQIVATWLFVGIMIIAVFAVVALVMKVRA